VGLLRREGALTATQAAPFVGESPSSCSFHLRQLAKYGLVQEAPGGRGRERPWRATALHTSWPNVARDPELAAASELLSAVVVERLFERVLRWLDRRADDSEEWQAAAQFGDTMLYLTANELAELEQDLQGLFDRYSERALAPEARPPGSRRVIAIHFAFPYSADE
jgi:predicted ArsR family transcriptional regulator